MRYLLLKKADPPGSILGETIGMITLPIGIYVDKVHPFDIGVYVFNISEVEYTSYQALELFPEYIAWPKGEPVLGNVVIVYNPETHCEDDNGKLKAK